MVRSKPVHAIPEEIFWLSRVQTCNLLQISEAQLRRDQAVLIALNLKQFDFQPGERGFSRESLEVLMRFRRLVREQGRTRAIKLIAQENDKHESTR